MSHRIAQIESTVHRALAQVLTRDINDPRITGMVSITRLDIAPDMKSGKAFVSVLPEKYESRTIAGLNDAASHIHRKLKDQLALRVVPRLTYKLDRSLKTQAKVLDAIRDGIERTTETTSSQTPNPIPTPTPTIPPTDSNASTPPPSTPQD